MPKIVDHDQRRSELLEPCLELFAARGFHALSVREIARNLEVTTGTIYHYFKSKSELFEKMIERVIELDVADAIAEVPVDLPWPAKILNLSHYLSARENRFAQIVHVLLDFRRYEAEESLKMTRRVLDAYRDVIRVQLNITDKAQLDTLFSLFIGMFLHRDLSAETSPIQAQLGSMLSLSAELSRES